MRFTIVVFLFCFEMANAQPVEIDYLYNSGWIIETTSSFVVIDFVPNDNDSLTEKVQKKIQVAIQHSKEVYVFVTHHHPDHYSPSIHSWAQPRITYVYGWLNSEAREGSIILANRDSIKINNIEIFAHPSTDAGSAFLIKLPELIFYHAGDHALWTNTVRKKYEDELHYIMTKEKVDVAFLPVARGKLTGCKTDDTMFSGAMNAHKILKPAITFPMHVGCGNFSVFADWKSYALKHKLKGKFEIPTQYDQQFKFTFQ